MDSIHKPKRVPVTVVRKTSKPQVPSEPDVLTQSSKDPHHSPSTQHIPKKDVSTADSDRSHTPTSWQETFTQQQKQNEEHKKNVISWIIFSSISILAIAIAGFSFVRQQETFRENGQSNLAVFANIDTNKRIKSRSTGSIFEVANPNWKSIPVSGFRVIEEDEQKSFTLFPDAWSLDSNIALFASSAIQSDPNPESKNVDVTAYTTNTQTAIPLVSGLSSDATAIYKWLGNGTIGFFGNAPRIASIQATGAQISQLDLNPDNMRAWDFAPQGDAIVIIEKNGRTALKHFQTGEKEILPALETENQSSTESEKQFFYDSPSFSPDGTRIAFIKRESTTSSDSMPDQVILLDAANPDRAEEKVLGEIPKTDQAQRKVLWSQDGSRLMDTITGTIFDTTSKAPLLSSQGFQNTTYRWSKANTLLLRSVSDHVDIDGDHIDVTLSTTANDGSKHVDIFRVTGSRQKNDILSHVFADWRQEEVVFTYDQHIWVVQADGNNLRRLELPEDDYQKVSISPDGTTAIATSEHRAILFDFKD